MDRRLAAILAADVVGYSRLMGQDEAGTLETLKDRRRTIFLLPLLERMVGESRHKAVGPGAAAEITAICAIVTFRNPRESRCLRKDGRMVARRWVEQLSRFVWPGQRTLAVIPCSH